MGESASDRLLGWFDFADLYGRMLGRLADGAHVVEVGTFCGKSAAWMAEAIRDSGKRITFHTIDSWAGVGREHVPDEGFWRYLDSIQRGGGLEAHARANLAPLADYVTVKTGDGIGAAADYADGSLDFVFLDDNHETAHVARECEAWWPKVKPGGVLAGHDWDWQSVQEGVGQWAVKMGVPLVPTSARCWQLEKPRARTAAKPWTVPAGERRCLVAVCCNERNVVRQTVKSLVRIGWGQRVLTAAEAHGFADIQFAWFDDAVLVSDLRDKAALAALQLGASHVLFLDADNTWPADVLTRMLRHHAKGIVAGLYFTKLWPYWPVALRGGSWNALTAQWDYLYDAEAVDAGDVLRQEKLVGMGCTLVPTEVFRQLPRPWFTYQANAQNGMMTITEDVWFCQQAARLGCPIWLDPSVVCDHIAQQPINAAWFERARAEMAMLERDGMLHVVRPDTVAAQTLEVADGPV